MNDYKLPRVIFFGKCQLVSARQTLSNDNLSFRLPRADTILLAYMLQHSGVIHTKESLLNIAWEGKPISQNSLAMAISNLRSRLSEVNAELDISSVPRMGYILNLSTALIVQEYDCNDPLPEHIHADTLNSNGSTISSKKSRLEYLRSLNIRKITNKHVVIINAIILIAIFIASLEIWSEWLHIECEDINKAATICALDGNSQIPMMPITELNSNNSLWLVSGGKVIKLNKSKLLNESELIKYDEK